MNKIATYVRLHLKLQFGKDDKADQKSRWITMITGVVTCVVMLLLLKYFFDMLFSQFADVVDFADFATVIFTAVEVVLIVFCVSLEIKCLLKPFDIKISARLPMTAFQMFVAELAVVYVNLQLLSTMLYLPLMAVFGWSANLLSVGFLCKVVGVSFLATLAPLAVGTLLAVPAMLVASLLSNKTIVKLVLFVAVLVGALVLYNGLLDILADYFIHQRIEQDSKQAVSAFVVAINGWYNVAAWLKNVLFAQNVWASIGLTFAFFAVVFAVGLAIAKPVYTSVRQSSLNGSANVFVKRGGYTSDSGFWAIFKRELKEIFRTNTYLFFYLGVAVSTPVMVFFCNKLIQKMGQAQLGGDIEYGVSLLVILAFMTMSNCFTASAVSREKETFYITKVTPMSFVKQLAAKGLLNLTVAVIALVVSVAIVLHLQFVTALEGVVIAASCLVSAVGMIAHGFNMNVKNPSLSLSTSGEISQTNMTLLMLVGLVYSAVQGGVAIVVSFLWSDKLSFVINLAVAVVYAAVNLLVFLFATNKRYQQIEFR